MPDPVFFRDGKHKWVFKHGTQYCEISNGGKTCKKKSNGLVGWNATCVIPLKQNYEVVKIKIDETNNDNSGFCVSVTDNTMTQANYSFGISSMYNTSFKVYPKKGDVMEFRINQISNSVVVLINGALGSTTKTISGFQRPIYIAAYLYYQNNQCTILEN